MIPPMRRLARRLFTLCSAVSLVLCVAAAVLWVRSYWKADLITRWYGPVSTLQLVPVFGSVQTASARVEVTHCCGWVSVRQCEPSFKVFGPDPKIPASRWEHGNPSPVDSARARLAQRYSWSQLGPPPQGWTLMGLRYVPQQSDGTRELFVPDWAVVLVTAVLPTFWLVAHVRKSRRRVTGRCVRCGYDLRASPERCPECGTTAAEI